MPVGPLRDADKVPEGGKKAPGGKKKRKKGRHGPSARLLGGNVPTKQEKKERTEKYNKNLEGL